MLQEIDQLVNEWKPEDLVPSDGLSAVAVRQPVVESAPGARVTVDGTPGVLHFASLNFWGFAGSAASQVRVTQIRLAHASLNRPKTAS